MAAQHEGLPRKNSQVDEPNSASSAAAVTTGAADDAADVVAATDKSNPADSLAPPRPPRLAGTQSTKSTRVGHRRRVAQRRPGRRLREEHGPDENARRTNESGQVGNKFALLPVRAEHGARVP